MMPARADLGLKCPADPAQSVVQARKALEAHDPKQDRIALVCLAEAVASLDRKFEGLRDGSVPFTGRIEFPRGLKFPETRGHK
jgi:hypothetical protein